MRKQGGSPQKRIDPVVTTGVRDRKQKLEGGNLTRGKTSDVELDFIYRRYLPAGLVLRCNTLPLLDHKKVCQIKTKLLSQGLLFFPLFIKHHWIAGILRHDHQAGFTLTTHDSAPSHYVYLELEDYFAQFSPELKLLRGECTRQKRGSEDCGIHMTAIFFATYLKVPIKRGDTLGARLRPFLSRVAKKPLDVPTFLKEMGTILSNFTYEGGETRRAPIPDEPPTRRTRRESNAPQNHSENNANRSAYNVNNKIQRTI